MNHSIQPANFLRHYRQRHTVRNKRIVAVAILGVAALLLLGLFSVRSLLRIAEKTQRAKDHLLYSMTLVEAQQFGAARTHVLAAETLLREVRSNLRPWKVTVILPFVGRQITAFDNTVATIDRLSVAFERVIVFADRMVTTIVGNKPLHFDAITPEQKRLFLAQLFEAGPTLQGIKADIDLAALSLARVPDRFLLPVLSDAIAPLKKHVPQLQHTMTVALPLLEAMPLVSGYPNPQTYLFLFQNNDELRPTGGFIGTYGILQLRDGEIQSLFTDNIYRLDRLAERKRLRVEPPPPIKRHLNVPAWFLRDANWSPDFPTTARQALWFYQKESDDRRPIDGVLAVDPTVVVRLLRLLGSITIDNTHFTPETFVDTLQFHVEKGYTDVGLPEVERKEVIGRLTKEMMQRIMTLPLEKIPDLLDIIESALRERHVLLYEANPALQHVVENEGWDGALQNTDANTDFFMLVDANLAALKTDSVMDRSITYTVTPDKDKKRLRAKATITYHNKGLFSWKTTRYRTYTRLYAPRGATLLRSDGFITEDKKRESKAADVGEELGKTVFGGYLIVEPRETKTLTVEYLLPFGVTNNAYTLFVQKQAGTEAHPLRVELQFGTTMKTWQPTGFTVEHKGNTLIFPTDLRVDRQFTVGF